MTATVQRKQFPTGIAAALALAASACSSIPPGRSAIDDVTVTNLHTIPASDVEDRLATASSPAFLGVFPGVVYDYAIFDETALQRDLARVERYLQGHGFFEAKARAGRIFQVSKDHVRVEIFADEGAPTLNQHVTLNGIETLPAAELAEIEGATKRALPRGKRFDEVAFHHADDVVKRALTDDGFAYAKVTSTVQVDVAEHTADYAITVVTGPKSKLGAITIQGLDPDGSGPKAQEISDKAVRRTLDLQEGETFSTAKLDAATQALLDLGVFSAVEIVPALPDPPNPVVPVTVRTTPTKLRVLKFGGGAEFDVFKSDLHLLIGWENHNFVGDLRTFSVEWRPGVVLYPLRIDNLTKPTNPLLEQRFRVELRQPGFLEARTEGFVRPEFNIFPLLIAPDPPSSDPVVGYIESKTAVGVERTFKKRFHASLSYTFQIEDPFSYVGPLNSALGVVVLGYPQLATNLDFRDSPIRPHEGVYLGNTLQIAGSIFGGDARDVKIQPEIRTYIPIGKHVTFGTRASLGFLFNFNYAQGWANELASSDSTKNTSAQIAQLEGDVERMYFRGFFSGGPNTNRGFPLFGVSPYGVVPFLNPETGGQQVGLKAGGVCIPGSTNYNASECFIPVGGSTLWELSNEIRYQISGPFSLANFCDMGDVSPNQSNIRLDHLHLSCGLGARYDTPVGPIRFDIGYRIQPLQVLGFKTETTAATPANGGNPVNGTPPTIFGQPIAFSIGVGEAF